jgi:hypothetical protein
MQVKHQHVAAVCPCSGTHTADNWNFRTDPVLHALNARLLASLAMCVHTWVHVCLAPAVDFVLLIVEHGDPVLLLW